MLVDDAEHLRPGEVLEPRPAQVLIGLAALVWIAWLRNPVMALGKDTPLDRLAESSGLALLQFLHLVEALDEDQVGDLLDHLERIGEPPDQKSFQMLSIWLRNSPVSIPLSRPSGIEESKRDYCGLGTQQGSWTNS